MRNYRQNTKMMDKLQVGIIEDVSLVLENLKISLESQPDFSVSLTANSVEEFLEQLEEQTPLDIIVLDIGLPGMSGLEGIRYLRERKPKVDIVMLTAYDDSDRIFKALCAGAVSYISKKTELGVIREALRVVSRGGSYMSPGIARKVITHFSPRQPNKDAVLTPRQEQIVEGLVEGLSYKMIADKYLISVETVRDHIKKIYKKLQVNSKAEVIRKKMDGEI